MTRQKGSHDPNRKALEPLATLALFSIAHDFRLSTPTLWLRHINVEGFGLSCRRGREVCSAGVSPAVAGASRSRRREVFFYTWKHRSIEGQEEAQEGAGKMPVPQRARRPRYL